MPGLTQQISQLLHSRTLRAFATALLCVLALSMRVSADGVEYYWNETTRPFWVIVLFLLCRFELQDRTIQDGGRLAAYISALFASFIVLGSIVNGGGFTSHGIISVVTIVIIQGIGYFIAIRAVVGAALSSIETARSGEDTCCEIAGDYVRHFFKLWLGMVVCWCIVLVPLFPGYAGSVDTMSQLAQYKGLYALSNHHPILMTGLFGVLYDMGYFIAGSDGAIVFTVLFQAALMSSVFSLSVVFLWRIHVQRKVCLLVYCLYCFIPIFPIYSQWMVKDVTSAALMLLLLLAAAMREWSLQNRQRLPWYTKAPSILILGFILCLTRNNCIFIVMILIVVLGLTEHSLAFMAKSLSLLICSYLLWYCILLPNAGVTMSASSEMISLPLQQTARYLVLYPDEVTSEEEKILRMLFGDERYESIEELYDPRISDDIKRGVQFDEVSFFDYLKVWAAQGLRHPKVYLDSALLSGIGYWWPSYPPYELIPINPKAIEQGGVWSLLGNEAPEFCFSDAANTTVKVLNIISNAPVLSQLYKPAIYVWTMLFALAVLASRKSIFAALPASLMVVLLVCMVSPLNSSMRYALPIAFSAPLLIGLLFAKNDVIKPAQFNMPSACQRLSGVRKEKCCE